jgi:hypothetical protein
MKQIELQKQLVQVSSQQGIKERQKRKGELTKSELAELPSETKLYRAVGKTYVLPTVFFNLTLVKLVFDFIPSVFLVVNVLFDQILLSNCFVLCLN